MATPWPRDERINVYIFNQPGCRWVLAHGHHAGHAPTDSKPFSCSLQAKQARCWRDACPLASGMTGTGLQAFMPPISGNDLIRLGSATSRRSMSGQFERRLAVTGCALAPSGLARGRGQPAVAASAFVPAASV